jgi:hypothetical protein
MGPPPPVSLGRWQTRILRLGHRTAEDIEHAGVLAHTGSLAEARVEERGVLTGQGRDIVNVEQRKVGEGCLPNPLQVAKEARVLAARVSWHCGLVWTNSTLAGKSVHRQPARPCRRP